MTFEVFCGIRCAPSGVMLAVPPPAGDLSQLKFKFACNAKELDSKTRNCFHDEDR